MRTPDGNPDRFREGSPINFDNPLQTNLRSFMGQETITVDQRRRQHSALAQADDELLFGAELDFLDKLDNLAILDPPEYRFDCLDRVTVTKRFVDVEFDFDFVL